MNRVKKLLARGDEFQQSHLVLGFPLAVVKKFGDDQAGNLAALIAYYGFFSLFPLLLVLVTVLGFVLSGNASLQHDILNSTFSQFPIIGDQLKTNVHSLNGSGVALVIGVVGTLYGGLGVCNAAQNAFNRVWHVPMTERPGFLPRTLRSLLLLLVVGGGIIATTVVSGFGSGKGTFGVGLRVAAVVVALAANFGLFVLAFRVLTVRDVAVRDLIPGAVIAAVAWQVLQMLGGYYVTHTLQNASQVYGFFGIVIGLLAWIYLQAQVVLYAAEVNVVRAHKLYPRAMFPPPTTEADRRAYDEYAQIEQRRPSEDIDVTFDEQHERREAAEQRGEPPPRDTRLPYHSRSGR
jgi:YihY family inner membrane protein